MPTLLVFARFPRAGQVKTRLAAGIGTAAALRVYRAMLFDSLERFCSVPAAGRRLFLSGCSEQEGRELLARSTCTEGFSIALQKGQDLGARLSNALREVGPCAGGFLILGADSPTVPLSYLRRAVRALARVPVVLGPAVDGGYYLLAVRESRRELFEGIDWGSNKVLEQTLSHLGPGEYLLLPRWFDLDTADDLEKVRQEVSHRPSWKNSRLRKELGKLAETPAPSSASNKVPTDSESPPDGPSGSPPFL
ncbi:MAG: TIGR04282 family arsenosugar biosynthesis glycosyltransferase [Acidobacteriota bacterium]